MEFRLALKSLAKPETFCFYFPIHLNQCDCVYTVFLIKQNMCIDTIYKDGIISAHSEDIYGK